MVCLPRRATSRAIDLSCNNARTCLITSSPFRATRKSSPGVNRCSQSSPRRRNHRNAARQRLERTDGGNARQRPCVWPPRDMERNAELREYVRDAVVGQPAGVGDARLGQGLPSCLRIADAVNPPGDRHPLQGFNQETVHFDCTFFVAPVTDPHNVPFGMRICARKEHTDIRPPHAMSRRERPSRARDIDRAAPGHKRVLRRNG